jgi:soluble lytic murein transglycosylase-like protein
MKKFLTAWLGNGILFSFRRGLWLSRLNASIVLLLIITTYVWQYWSLLNNQKKLEQTRDNVEKYQGVIMHLEEVAYEENKQLQLLQKANETYCAIQMLMGPRASAEETVKLANIIIEQSKLYGYDPLLIIAIIQVESQFRTTASGINMEGEPSGALGLMQIKPSTVKSVAMKLGLELSHQNLMDAETNVSWGLTYLTRLLLYFGDIRTAIVAYNIGLGKVEDKLARGEILPKQYHQQVMNVYSTIQKRVQTENLLE